MRKAVPRTINVPRVIVWMDFVATAVATTNAWLVRPRKKAADSTAFADPSNTIQIRTMIAPWAHVTGKTRVKTTMAYLAWPRRSVCRIIAWTACVAETSAWAVVKLVPPAKKAAGTTAFVEISPMQRIPITNVIPANAMGLGRVMRRLNQRSPMVLHVRRQRNALRVFAPTACVAIVGV